MTVTEHSADRGTTASRWQAARQSAAAKSGGNAELRPDQRVEKAKPAEDVRPHPQDRAAESDARARPSPTAKLFDVLV